MGGERGGQERSGAVRPLRIHAEQSRDQSHRRGTRQYVQHLGRPAVPGHAVVYSVEEEEAIKGELHHRTRQFKASAVQERAYGGVRDWYCNARTRTCWPMDAAIKMKKM